MTAEKFLNEAGKNLHDNLPERIKILGPIQDAEPVKPEQLISKKGPDGYEYRLAVNVKVPGLNGVRNLMVRTTEYKMEYHVHGCKHLMESVNPNTKEITIPKGAYTFCVI